MIPAPTPANERERLATLRSLRILDTPPEDRFDRITRIARRLFNVPISIITLVDADRQWFKSKQGISACETPRSISFCGHAILQEHTMVVQDALQDNRFRDNPLVTGDPRIRFYAGYPLSGPDGSKLGSLCIIDQVPRTLSAEDARSLASLGQMVEAELVALNLTTVDALTGVANLRGYVDIARHILALVTRLRQPAQLLLVKLEAQEETAMKRSLVEVSQALLTSFRESDLVARVGDLEFAVLRSRDKTESDGQDLERLENILEAINADRPRDERVCAQVVTVPYVAARHETPMALIAEAEERMATCTAEAVK